jgi:hypothetical protein
MSNSVNRRPLRRLMQAGLDQSLKKAADILRGNVGHYGFRGYVFCRNSRLNFKALKPLLPPLPVRHTPAQESIECRTVVMNLEMAKLVDNHVVNTVNGHFDKPIV